MSYSSVRLIILSIFLVLLFTIPQGTYRCSLPEQKKQHIVLITGFEPFGSYECNPSQLIAEELNGQEFDNARIYGVVLPVDFNSSATIATRMIDVLHPDVVISIGLEAKTKVIHVEHLGINLQRDPFGNGSEKRFHFIARHSPLILHCSLPIRSIVCDLRNAGIPVQQSWCAGTYACNTLIYKVMQHINEHTYHTKAGFLHIPLLSQDSEKGMDFSTMIDAVKIVISTTLKKR